MPNKAADAFTVVGGGAKKLGDVPVFTEGHIERALCSMLDLKDAADGGAAVGGATGTPDLLQMMVRDPAGVAMVKGVMQRMHESQAATQVQFDFMGRLINALVAAGAGGT